MRDHGVTEFPDRRLLDRPRDGPLEPLDRAQLNFSQTGTGRSDGERDVRPAETINDNEHVSNNEAPAHHMAHGPTMRYD